MPIRGTGREIPWTNPLFVDAQARSRHRSAGAASLWEDPRERGELPDVYIAMGQTAENVAAMRGVGRVEQDEFAARSQQLYEQAATAGFWKREITADHAAGRDRHGCRRESPPGDHR